MEDTLADLMIEGEPRNEVPAQTGAVPPM